ncbi:MAG TPA: argininosuccinate lyase [Acetobacteraceae bacterium]|nr:argininosuccinate lyase [Acetobacteraceae bacterium]
MQLVERPLIAAALLVTLTASAFAGDADFKLVNRTGYQIDSVYVSPASSKAWGHDIMGKEAVADGEAVNVTFPHGDSACRFDIKVKYNDGDDAEWGNIDLCQYETISLFWDGKQTRAVGE